MQQSQARRKVLIANGRATSGQASLFPMLPPLVDLAQRFRDVLFVYTNTEHEPRVPLPDNVRFAREIIGIPAPQIDLNECGFVSTFCDLIVGRWSGAYTFSMIKPNLLRRPTRFLTFSNVTYPYWASPPMRDRIPFSCTVTQCKDTGHRTFVHQVETELQRT